MTKCQIVGNLMPRLNFYVRIVLPEQRLMGDLLVYQRLWHPALVNHVMKGGGGHFYSSR